MNGNNLWCMDRQIYEDAKQNAKKFGHRQTERRINRGSRGANIEILNSL